MHSPNAQLQIRGLSSKRKAELAAQARQRGISPQRYARELVESGLDFEREARRRSFDEILAPLRESAGDASDAELEKLVDRARMRHHQSARKKGR